MTLEELRQRFPSLAADRRLLRNDVYAVLLAGIITGDLAPGERLKDGELTDALRVSRTPVREAIGRLQQVGLIRTAPNRYTLVSPLEIREIVDVIGVLRLLMPPAIRHAVQGVDVDTELELTVVAERLERESDGMGDTSPIDAFQRSTAAILAVIPDRVLAETIENLIPRFVRYVTLSDEGAAAVSRERVLEFVRAVVLRDDKAAAVLEEMLLELSGVLSPRVGGAG
ncbi:DNA-binding GntR family transcriptional regulator [Leifsonia sp. EB41]|uniref:GntR family transcriptional regulator n=1 Tax=Leifsonia sp. EB41 TaxID=3156260 RepID=UPI003512FF94